MLLPLLLSLAPLQETVPATVPERTGYARTSLLAEVEGFLDALADLPRADRFERRVLGHSLEGRPLHLVRVQEPDRGTDPPLRVLLLGNIHAGEVEGKEALQQILRELGQGRHGALLEGAVLYVLPVYNPDGNEAVSRSNRVTQNGPEEGVGERANAQGLDLNRDFVKAESPECRALLGLLREVDPHVFVDLHTTNGTYHGYHLTYAPSLCPDADPDLDRYARGELLPAVTSALEGIGWRTFHYGNADRERTEWSTYDHRPRFGTNYHGLRGRLAVLSEAYSYLEFEQRIAVTRAFVLEVLGRLVEDREEVLRLCRQADERALAGGLALGTDTGLVPGAPGEILMGEVSELELPGLGTRRMALDVARPVEMRVRVAFEAGRREPLPEAWALLDPPASVIERLALHGVRHWRLPAAAALPHQRFELDALRRAPRPFQGHHEIELEGRWVTGEGEVPAGAWLVPARQPLARLAAWLLEPASEDSLATWNLWGDRVSLSAGGGPGEYPVLRLAALPE